MRCESLLRKAKEAKVEIAFEPIDDDQLVHEEEALLLTVAKFRHAVLESIKDCEPAFLARYLIDLSKVFNRFYYHLPVMQATDPVQRA